MSSKQKLINHIQTFIQAYEKEYIDNQLHLILSDQKETCPVYNGALDVFNAYLSLDLERIQAAARRMAKYNLQENRPYVLVINTIQSFKHKILQVLLEDPSAEMAADFYKISAAAEGCLAQSYLNDELEKFTKFNTLRLQSINRLNDINTLYLYEEHLLWFDTLTRALRQKDMSILPELDHCKCVVGKWILEEGKDVITDETIFKGFIHLHKNLHLIAQQIKLSFTQKPIDFHILMLLLNKAELFSLAMGVELSIINNIRFQTTASKDPLTGTLNRQLLPHIFSTQFELSRAIEKSFCLILMDLDNFKDVNDKHGHVEGDKVLQVFSDMLLRNLRESDFAIRYGGEEFLLILPSTHLEHAVSLAEKLKKQSHSLQKDNNLKEHITASFGVIQISPSIDEVPNETLMTHYIQEVDKELYYAKNQGKDQVSSKRLSIL